MNDMGTLILIGIIVVAVVLLMQRLMGSQNNWSRRGNEYPQTDNPNISSHGGFGGQPQRPQRQNRQYDDPNIASHGGFGRGSASSMAQGQQKTVTRPERATERRRDHDNDDPNVDSRGGFGRS